MNAITKTEAARPSLIAVMAQQRNMDPDTFARTVRSTVMPANHTNEQFAALMLVASKYDLDPITKEIYAFPAKGGGIVPIVSIDGWLNLMNSHPAFDGFDIEFVDGEDGNPISCTCRMYRKDRSRPVIVTEYLSECIRQTDPWKMKHRMLRHKTVIQTIRYAFGFSGVYDEDEGAKIAEMRDVTPEPARPQPPRPPAQIEQAIDPIPDNGFDADLEIDADPVDDEPSDADSFVDDDTFLQNLEDALAVAGDEATIEEVWTEHDALARFEGNENYQAIAQSMKGSALKRVGA